MGHLEAAGNTPTDKQWVQPNSTTMRVRWDSLGATASSSFVRVVLPFLLGMSVYYGMILLGSTDMLAFGTSMIAILLSSTYLSIKAAKESLTGTDSNVESRNRELVDKVRQETDWHPASFALVFTAAGRGKVDIYSGTADEALERVKEWYQREALQGELTCRAGHNPLCKHTAPAFSKWATSPVSKTGGASITDDVA